MDTRFSILSSNEGNKGGKKRSNPIYGSYISLVNSYEFTIQWATSISITVSLIENPPYATATSTGWTNLSSHTWPTRRSQGVSVTETVIGGEWINRNAKSDLRECVCSYVMHRLCICQVLSKGALYLLWCDSDMTQISKGGLAMDSLNSSLTGFYTLLSYSYSQRHTHT